MIKSIEKIQNMGVYRDYKKPLSMADFKKYNLFYGTLSSGADKTSVYRKSEGNYRTGLYSG